MFEEPEECVHPLKPFYIITKEMLWNPAIKTLIVILSVNLIG